MTKISNQQVLSIHSQGLSDRKASKILGCCHAVFRFRRMKLHLLPNGKSFSSEHVPLEDYDSYIKKAHQYMGKWVNDKRKIGLYKIPVRNTEISLAYEKENRKSRVMLGLCSSCGKERSNKNYLLCVNCREKGKFSTRKVREKLLKPKQKQTKRKEAKR